MAVKFFKEHEYRSEKMLLSKFLKQVKSKKLSDKLGYAKLATSVNIYPITVKPSEINFRRFDDDITHVVWYWYGDK